MAEIDGGNNFENAPQKSFDELLLWLELERKFFENYWRGRNAAKKRCESRGMFIWNGEIRQIVYVSRG